MFNGYKTYIAGAILFIAGGLLALGVIDQQVFEIIAGLAGSLGLYGIRSAISNK